MSRRVSGSVVPALMALSLVLLLIPTQVGAAGAGRAGASGRKARAATPDAGITSNFGRLPLAFELNAGQSDAPVRYLAHGAGYTLGLTPSAALLTLQAPVSAVLPRDRFTLPGQPTLAAPATPPARLGMAWLGANPHPLVTGEQPLPGTVNYFIGNNPKQWRTNVPTYQQVRYHNIYPGVDLVYYGNQGQPEYDFVVAPGASPAAIRLGFTGAQGVGLDLQGNLSLALPGGSIAQEKPLVYQTVANGARQPIAGGYTLNANQRVGFALGAYNPHLPLVIDPFYRFSTYFGGSGFEMSDGGGIAVDASGNVYITGDTFSTDLPTANPEQATNAGNDDAFVSKLNAAGSALLYSTYLGGNDIDAGQGIAVDASGNAYITGYTQSINFPTTFGAEQVVPHGGDDAFVSKLSAAGNTLVYSTYLGGSAVDIGERIAVDASGSAYVAGVTQSADFPVQGAFQAAISGSADAFVSKLNASGSALTYSTYLGGSGIDDAIGIAVDSSGSAYVAGETASTDFPTHAPLQPTNAGGTGDAFVSKFNAAGSALVYSTYLGGSGADAAIGIAVDSSGSAYVAGQTTSTNFPTNPAGTLNGGKDAFVSKLNASGSALVYSSYLGGSGDDGAAGIAVDGNGDAYLTGITASTDFPLVDPLQSTLRDSGGSAFVVRFDANDTGGLPVFSTYLSGSSIYADLGEGIAVSAGGNVYVVGETSSTDFPTFNALYPVAPANPNAFVTEIFTSLYPVATPGVFRSSNATFYLHTGNVTSTDLVATFGAGTDVPVVGDWTGKGYDSIGVFRNGTWFLRNSNTTGPANITLSFGAAGDLPIAGDWTGKGYASVGVYRPSNNTFYLRNSNTTGPADITAKFGASGDVPIVGDWTGKGYDSIGVYRPSLGAFLTRNSNTTGSANLIAYFGAIGDTPVVGDWTGQGKTTIGVYRAATSTFYLRNSITTSAYADLTVLYGAAGDKPLVGQWAVPLGGGTPPPRATSAHLAAATPTRRPAVR